MLSRILVLEAIYIMSTNTLPASAANMHLTSYFRRQTYADVCGAENLLPCDHDGLPDNYCCRTGTRCLFGAARTTIVCCPEGSDCEAIKPILCDLSNQDPNIAPESLVKSILLDGTLQSCGLGCCPWGYHCNTEANGQPACYRDEDQDSFPGSAIISSSSQLAGPTGTKTATSTGSFTPGVSTSPSDDSGSSEGSDGEENNTVAIGLGVGITSAVLLILAGAFFIARKKRQQSQIRGGGEESRSSDSHVERKRSSSLSFGNFISEPIMNPDTLRSDFGRLKEAGGSSTANSTGTTHVNATTSRDSIERYWGKGPWFSDARRSSNTHQRNSNRPYMAAGPKMGIAKIRSASGNTSAPQNGEISMTQPETSVTVCRGGNGESDMSNPFRDNTNRYDHHDVDGRVHPKSVSSSSFASVAVPAIRAMNSSTSRPYTPTPERKRRPTTPPNKNNKAITGMIDKNRRSCESSGTKIDVFADPATLADSPGLGNGGLNEGSRGRSSTHTTFSDMMERADLGDLARGGPYILSPWSSREVHGTPMRKR